MAAQQFVHSRFQLRKVRRHQSGGPVHGPREPRTRGRQILVEPGNLGLEFLDLLAAAYRRPVVVERGEPFGGD